jgi:hypothetical protein
MKAGMSAGYASPALATPAPPSSLIPSAKGELVPSEETTAWSHVIAITMPMAIPAAANATAALKLNFDACIAPSIPPTRAGACVLRDWQSENPLSETDLSRPLSQGAVGALRMQAEIRPIRSPD